MTIPQIESHIPELMAFARDLSDAVERGIITDADAIARRVLAFFTPQQMAQVNTIVPTWTTMASYGDGKTLIHIITALVALLQLPEYRAANAEQQELARWIVFFHDVAKVLVSGKRDHIHAFRSAAVTGEALPSVGFTVTGRYAAEFPIWKHVTTNAVRPHPEHGDPVQDNSKLPAILRGIDALFGIETPSSLVVRGVLLHMSITNLQAWPQSAPLSDAEIARSITLPLFPLLRMMMLVDNDAWHLFEPDIRRAYRAETLDVFTRVQRLITTKTSTPGVSQP